ncbi:hypothetical protein [Falsiroseomonas sp. CW058]|uniref:hypothetical protein n=1 Tax=Falsiroseomonas sp. CW058 TaxID=3388664 RepID=UPI003D30FAC8
MSNHTLVIDGAAPIRLRRREWHPSSLNIIVALTSARKFARATKRVRRTPPRAARGPRGTPTGAERDAALQDFLRETYWHRHYIGSAACRAMARRLCLKIA